MLIFSIYKFQQLATAFIIFLLLSGLAEGGPKRRGRKSKVMKRVIGGMLVAAGIGVADEGIDVLMDSKEEAPKVTKVIIHERTPTVPPINHTDSKGSVFPEVGADAEWGFEVWYGVGGVGIGFSFISLGIFVMFYCKRCCTGEEGRDNERENENIEMHKV